MNLMGIAPFQHRWMFVDLACASSQTESDKIGKGLGKESKQIGKIRESLGETMNWNGTKGQAKSARF